ncbi:MAG TPA: hypothetical protein VH079_19395 [Terriglobales bacterium]|jgi:lysophospholipase L1-like esterase|nr:hypothetical protein [Terriglobales bacterium]
MTTNDVTANAIAFGRERAKQTLVRRDAALAKRAKALSAHRSRLEMNIQNATTQEVTAIANVQTAGFLVAVGDSWFDYPLHSDVLDLLEDEHGYNVESTAHHGDPIETMAYQNGQLDKVARCLEKITAQGAVPKAVLVSGGGDDIAGKEFGMLLNSANSQIHGWNEEIVDGVLNQRILTAFKYMLSQIEALCQAQLGKTIPVLVHGYDYPVPDGRGFLGFLAGPWLQPGFREKFFNDLQNNIALLHVLIDRFNAILAELVKEASFSYVHYVDLRNTLSGDLTNDAYKAWWDNELHPTEPGFSAVAAKFAAALSILG